MRVRAKLTGKSQFIRSLASASIDMRWAAAGALYLNANDIMTNAKERTPVDTGAMKGSGYVTVPKDIKKIEVELGFGGPSKAYVIKQHESTAFKHEVGEAKFLENALDAAKTDFAKKLARRIEALFKARAKPMQTSMPADPWETFNQEISKVETVRHQKEGL